MGNPARGNAERRPDSGEFRRRFRELDNEFRCCKSKINIDIDAQGSSFLPVQQWLKHGNEGEGYIFYIFAGASLVAFLDIGRACRVYERSIASSE